MPLCYEQAKAILVAVVKLKGRDFCGFLTRKLFVLVVVMRAFWIGYFLIMETEVYKCYLVLLKKNKITFL